MSNFTSVAHVSTDRLVKEYKRISNILDMGAKNPTWASFRSAEKNLRLQVSGIVAELESRGEADLLRN